LRKRAMALIVLIVSAFPGLFSLLPVNLAQADPGSPLAFKDIVTGIDMTSIDQHVRHLSNLGSRFTGYPGCDAAAEYIFSQLSKYCDSVQYDLYNTTVPIDLGARIVLPNKTEIQAYTLMPNLIETSVTPEQGLSGSLVYVGKGYPSDIEGKPIRGNIILMDFNSRDNWIDVASLGAKAVIFIEPQETVTSEADSKCLRTVPLPFTRLYVKSQEASRLIDLASENQQITVFSSMAWQEKVARNIIGRIQGSDPNTVDTVIVYAYYDATSAVPGVAPGANEATGVSALMEFAKFISQNRPRRTTILIAFSGHAQALAGARNFITKVIQQREYLDFMRPLILASGFDFSSETDKLTLLYLEYFYGFGWGWTESSTIYWMQGFFVDQMKGKMNEVWQNLYQKTYDVFGPQSFVLTGIMGPDLYTPMPFASEIGIFTGCTTAPVLFRTAFSAFNHLNTPIDTYEKVDLKNVRPQIEYAFCSLYSFLNVEKYEITTSFKRALGEQAPALGAVFGTIIGQISEYDIERNAYIPVPNALVFAMPFPLFGYNHYMITMADQNGIFRVTGLRLGRYYTVHGYKLNETGALIYASDQGLYGANRYSNNFIITAENGILGSYETPRNFVAFKCGSMVLYKYLANYYRSPSAGLGAAALAFFGSSLGASAFASSLVSVRVIGAESKAPEPFFGYNAEPSMIMVYVKEGRRVQILASVQAFTGNLYLNASEVNPLGSGYAVETGETLSINMLQNSRDLSLMNDYRFSITHMFSIFTGVEPFHKGNIEALKAAESYLQQKRTGEFYKSVLDVWGRESLVYGSVRGVLQDVTYSTIIYYALLIPFAIMLERVLFGFREGAKRYGVVLAIFTFFVLFLYFFHPGFRIASSTFAMILGFTIFVFSLPLLLVITNKLTASFMKLRERVYGYHFAEISRVGAFGMSFSVGLSYLKKHKLQSLLVATSIILINIAVVTFTTMATYSRVNVYAAPGQATHKGIFIRDPTWQGISRDFVKYLEARFIGKAYVSPRAWWYPKMYETGTVLYTSSSEEINLRAVQGFSWSESTRDFGIANALLPGGRWFDRNDYKACILPSNLASTSNIKVGDEVDWMGLKLKVVGILDYELANTVLDLDQHRPAPLNPRLLPRIIFYDVTSVLIVPYDLLMDVFGDTYTVAIVFPQDASPETIEREARELAATSSVDIYLATETGGKISRTSLTLGIYAFGYQLILVPLAILACVVFTMMFNLVNQRGRDMSVLSSVGLSPLHVAGMFLSEAASYAFIGSVVGYTLSISIISILTGFHLLPPEIYPNYSSRYVMFAVLITMAAVSVSSVYPLLLSAKLVTPSLVRRWRIESKPVGDKWQIHLPFTFPDKEMPGVRAFLKEFFETHTTMEVGAPFVASNVSTYDRVEEATTIRGLKVNTHIAPFPLGVSQEVDVILSYDTSANKGSIQIVCTRLAGVGKDWESSNRTFIDVLRKQFLIWRALDPSRREEYVQRR